MVRMALTGHRPERLGYPDLVRDISPEWRRLIDGLKDMIKESNVTDAYCGMADGRAIAFGIAVLELKNREFCQVRLHCVLPCRNYGRKSQ